MKAQGTTQPNHLILKAVDSYSLFSVILPI